MSRIKWFVDLGGMRSPTVIVDFEQGNEVVFIIDLPALSRKELRRLWQTGSVVVFGEVDDQ